MQNASKVLINGYMYHNITNMNAVHTLHGVSCSIQFGRLRFRNGLTPFFDRYDRSVLMDNTSGGGEQKNKQQQNEKKTVAIVFLLDGLKSHVNPYATTAKGCPLQHFERKTVEIEPPAYSVGLGKKQ